MYGKGQQRRATMETAVAETQENEDSNIRDAEEM